MSALSLRSLAQQLGGEVTGDQVACPGPNHSAKDRSMTVKPDAKAPGGFIVFSHSGDDIMDCRDYVRARLGLPKWEPGMDPQAASSAGPSRIVATYDYVDADGVLVKQAVRYEPKKFRQRRPDPGVPGGWIWQVKGMANVPYRLPELRAAHHDEPVFIVEGEKDADALAALGITATTSIGGAGNWTPDLNLHFAWRTVYILADNDKAGGDHAADVAAGIFAGAEAVHIVSLPGLPPKGDVSDWLAAGNDPAGLLDICQAFPRFDPDARRATGAAPEDEGPRGTGEEEQERDPYKLLWHGDADDTPLKEWLVDKMLPKRGTALLSGQWGLYKTFVGFDLSASIMTKTPFAGRAVERQGGVLWLAVEGQDEVRIRLAGVANDKVKPALAESSDAVSFGVDALPFAWLEACPKLSDPNALSTLQRIVAGAAEGMLSRFGLPLALVLIDTLSPAAQFKDANDSSEAQRVMSVLKAVALEFDTLVLAVDHMGKDVSTGTRNSSVKEADVDATLALLGDRDLAGNVTNARMGIRKVRGAATGAEIKFEKRVVLVPTDAEEHPTTLVIDWAASADTAEEPSRGGRKTPWAGKVRLLKDCIERVMISDGIQQHPFGADGPRVKAVQVAKVQEEFYRSYAADKQNAKRMAFTRMLSDAVTRGWVATREIGASLTDWVWFIVEEPISN